MERGPAGRNAPPKPRPVLVLIKALSATGRGSDRIRQEAARDLEAMGGAAWPALPALHRLLPESDFRTCRHAACIIWKLEGDLSVLPFFLQALKDTHADRAIIECLGEMGAAAESAVPLLRAFVDSAERPYIGGILEDERLRAAAVKALARITAALAGR